MVSNVVGNKGFRNLGLIGELEGHYLVEGAGNGTDLVHEVFEVLETIDTRGTSTEIIK